MPPALSAAIPPPVGGWNARDSLDRMPETDAVILDNLFPQPVSLQLRNGHSSHATGLGGAVQTLFEFREQSGDANLIAAANGAIWNVTSSGAASDITGTTTPTVNKWQTVVANNTAIMVNGTDQPQQIDSALSVTDVTYTGVTDNNLIDVTAYSNRLWFVEKNSASVWYTATSAISGAVTEFDVQTILRRGGEVLWVSSWTRDSGSGAQDLLVICSTMGEVLAYSGDPAGTFSLFGRFFLPIPLGVRSKVEFGSDLLVITQQGVFPMSKIFAGNEEFVLQTGQVTDKIQDAFRSTAALRKANFGWEAILYPQGNYLLINIPIAEDTTSQQYVMNTLTGAWCRFTGMDASSWSLLSENLYFGGVDGVVYKADTGSTDNSSDINAEVKTAFNFFGDRLREKRFTLARPILSTDASLTFNFGIDTDFEDTATTAAATTTGAIGGDWGDSWDTSDWASGQAFTKDWRSVTGIGRSAAVKLRGAFENVNMSISGFHVVYEPGGIL